LIRQYNYELDLLTDRSYNIYFTCQNVSL